MKTVIIGLSIFVGILFSCNSTKELNKSAPQLASDTIRIANDEVEYDVTIIDGGFRQWFNTNARPKNMYTQNYLESRNRIWVLEWNRRAQLPSQYNSNLYELPINYESNINYGFDVNYMIYNYLVYFQMNFKQPLGGFQARL